MGRVNGSRRYSVDLPQGGVEIPCILFFSGEPSLIKKIMKLTTEPDHATNGVEVKNTSMNSSGGNDSIVDITDDYMPPPKKKKLSDDVWVCWKNSGLRLTMADRETLVVGEELNDTHINNILKDAKGTVSRFMWTLLAFEGICNEKLERELHSGLRGNHWFTASTIGCCVKEVKVYDSLYNDIDLDSKAKIQGYKSHICSSAKGSWSERLRFICSGIYNIACFQKKTLLT